MELNPETDLSIDVANLSSEFKVFPLKFYRYCQYKAQVELKRDVAKAKLKEARAVTYKRIKGDTTKKWTENSMEAEIDTDPVVLAAQLTFMRAEHDATTWCGAVDSMKAKKDVLIQLGSDRRKEI